jgi:hypothetical protein
VPPKTRRTLRRVALVVAVLAAISIGGAYWYVEAQTIATRCESEPPAATSGHRQEWDWWPPGYECIFHDDQGRTTARVRPRALRFGDLAEIGFPGSGTEFSDELAKDDARASEVLSAGSALSLGS